MIRHIWLTKNQLFIKKQLNKKNKLKLSVKREKKNSKSKGKGKEQEGHTVIYISRHLSLFYDSNIYFSYFCRIHLLFGSIDLKINLKRKKKWVHDMTLVTNVHSSFVTCTNVLK